MAQIVPAPIPVKMVPDVAENVELSTTGWHNALCSSDHLPAPNSTIRALMEYLEMNNIKPSSLEFIFRSIVPCKDKAFSLGDKKLTYMRAREHFLQILTEIGLNAKEYGTHSLRSGSAFSGDHEYL
uniref:Uncharacterized protein n=1 Tax=Romanomermis culicivorax TaxID=13658 RepID=A0A915IZX7_ROMCU